jgi:hypothetical protein
MGHIVTATMIVAKTEDSERYLHKGNTVPEDVPSKERKRLLSAGLIEKVADPDPAPTSTGEAGPTKPAANAGLDKWLVYATEIGLEIPAEAADDKAKVRELVDAHEAATSTT